MVRRTLAIGAAVLLVLAMMAGPAAAHILTVDPPGAGDGPPAGPFEPGSWVGGGTLPSEAQGNGLIPSPFGLQPPSHATGLNSACEALRENGNGVVDIFGPGGPGCPHGH